MAHVRLIRPIIEPTPSGELSVAAGVFSVPFLQELLGAENYARYVTEGLIIPTEKTS